MRNMLSACVLAWVAVTPLAWAASPGYLALEGATSTNAVYDLRTDNVQKAMIYLSLIHDTYKDPQLTAAAKPKHSVIFMGPAVKLLSVSRDASSDISAEQRESYQALDAKIDQMIKDGIQIEFCNFAARMMKLETKTLHAQVQNVDNGWVSLIAYQNQDYGLVVVH